LNVTLSLSSGTGPLVGTTALNIGTAGGRGTVTFTNVQVDSPGVDKQLSAAAGSLTSAESDVFTVNGTPNISNIADQGTNEDTPTAAIPFTIGDAELPAAALALSATSGNTNLVPEENIVFSGSGSNRFVTVTPLPNLSGSAMITVIVFDGTITANDKFLLTVNPVNDAPTLSPIANLAMAENSGPTNVLLVGISSGAANENQTLSITASSSNTNLIATPTVTYNSPNPTGAPLCNERRLVGVPVDGYKLFGFVNGGALGP
jgi:hypothetical protein